MGRRISVLVLAICLLACGGPYSLKRPDAGLRWTGDVQVAADAKGAVVGGLALRFRYATELRSQPSGGDGWSDALLGSWAGIELSGAVLTGAIERGQIGTLGILGARPWIGRRQNDWFLETQRLSLLGVLIPDVGAAFGFGGGPHWALGWQVPLGNDDVQIVPGFSWLSPGSGQRFLGTIAFRVPM